MFLILKSTDWKEEDYIKHNIVPFGWCEDNNRAIPSNEGIFTFAESNLHKAIKINGGISKRTAYDLLDTADIEKENYYRLESLTRHPIEGTIGFNPTALKKQNECMKHGVDYVR